MSNEKYVHYTLFFMVLLSIAQQPLPAEIDISNADLSTIGIFAHGYGGNAREVQYYESLFKVPLSSFNFPDAQDGYLNSRETSLAQDNEIEAFMDECAKHTNNEKILIGVSRGASTIINSLGLHRISGVRAVILESPFDHVQSIASNFIPKLFRFIPGIRSIAHWGTFFVCQKYKRNGVQPINVVDAISQDIPLLFICSQTDKLIPYESTMRLYARLRAAGRQNVHILVLEHGRHAQLSKEKLYRWVVNAFLKKYGLLHDKRLARRGYGAFCLCQPDLATVDESSLRPCLTS